MASQTLDIPSKEASSGLLLDLQLSTLFSNPIRLVLHPLHAWERNGKTRFLTVINNDLRPSIFSFSSTALVYPPRRFCWRAYGDQQCQLMSMALSYPLKQCDRRILALCKNILNTLNFLSLSELIVRMYRMYLDLLQQE